jgi:hypothetical protein
MSDTLAPNVSNYRAGGGVCYFKKQGHVGGYTDLGNLPDVALSTLAQYLEHKSSRSGKIVTDRRVQTEAGLQFKISKDELNAANLAKIFNAEDPIVFSQANSTNNTFTIVNPVLGDDYDLGALRVSEVVVKNAANDTMTIQTDFSLEPDLGTIRPLPGGAILANDTITVTYTKAAITGEQIGPLSSATLIRGAIILYIRDEDGTLWKYSHTLATLGYDGDLSMTGNAFAKVNCTITIEPDFSKAQDNGRFGTLVMVPAA